MLDHVVFEVADEFLITPDIDRLALMGQHDGIIGALPPLGCPNVIEFLLGIEKCSVALLAHFVVVLGHIVRPHHQVARFVLPSDLSLYRFLLRNERSITEFINRVPLHISEALQVGHLDADEVEPAPWLIEGILLEADQLLVKEHGRVGEALQTATQHAGPIIAHEAQPVVIVSHPLRLRLHLAVFDFACLLLNA